MPELLHRFRAGSAWRIGHRQSEPHLLRGISNVPAIGAATFEPRPGAGFLPVLADLRLAEAFAAYANGDRLYDVGSSRFDLADLGPADAGPSCLAPLRFADAKTLVEVHDDQVRRPGGPSPRGEVLRLWSALSAANYRYLIEYGFREDGAISCRFGTTGHNAFPLAPDGRDAHLHVGCWRIEFSLGNPQANRVEVVELRSGPSGGRALVAEEFGGGLEGSVPWRPEAYTRLRVRNGGTGLAYEVVPERWGIARTYGRGEEFLAYDFWVTRASPDHPDRADLEWWYARLPHYASYREPLAGKAVVVWHHAPLAHIPRGEDFGTVDYDPAQGVALTM